MKDATTPGVHHRDTGEPRARRGGTYVTFYLGSEEYGFPIHSVREIIGIVPITPVPLRPDYIRGVVNLRGVVIPVIDLRARFGMPPSESSRENCIIVVRTHGVDSGILVDRMSEVADIAEDEVQDAPSFGTQEENDIVLGIGRARERVKLLLDVEKLLITKAFSTPASVGEGPQGF